MLGIKSPESQNHKFSIQSFFAKQYIKFYPKEMFIVVAGLVGKSTTMTASKILIETQFPTIIAESSANNPKKLFSSFLKITPNIKKVILEANIEISEQIEEVINSTNPKTVIMTNLNFDNGESLGFTERSINGAKKLLANLSKDGVAILNHDDHIVRKLAEDCKGQVIFFGSDPKNCHIWAGNYKVEDFKSNFELNFGVERIEVKSFLLGSHQTGSLMAATCLALTLDIPFFKIKGILERVQPLEHALQVFNGQNGAVILDDSVNDSPIAVSAALDTLNLLSARRRILVLGEMKNLGHFSEKIHRNIAKKIFAEKIDLVFLAEGDTKYIEDELLKLGLVQERIHSQLNNSQLVNTLLTILSKGDIVLVSGSSLTRLDEVVKRISKISHPNLKSLSFV